MTPPPLLPPATDLLIVGGGPAGCAAALTAAGVGMRSLLLEQDDRLCGKLWQIPALDNVLGGHRTGPDLAAAITADLARSPLCTVATGARVTSLTPHDTHITVTTHTGTEHHAPHAVLATGVGPLTLTDTDWITAPDDLHLSPLWDADPATVTDRTVLVLGADRPLGTFLRAHPDLKTTLLVPHPPTDAYKAEEAADDPRVTLLPTHRITVALGAEGEIRAELETTDGTRRTLTADAAFTNLGNAATVPPGGAVRDATGYCPPGEQHPRLLTAGDVRSARYQRIMTAIGSGTEAALRAYYTTRNLAT
ncbi:FAD-dependent oxidoreductase [Streptomyces sp. YIM 98790]|uniref:FAD-dependent oxidoreductase n=1 Tax=Streptomyces sp. YIM 98790 TaxID=2689077 RepID=UPI0028BE4498|nr:FAD-dependent oxidoreductase [Streptomyces sp. YIM 98790]